MTKSDIWGITAYFNPCEYKSRYKNFKIFRQSSKKQGLKLIVVELATNNQKFVLKKSDAEILVQVKSQSTLWQKERLLNIGLEHLPKSCKKVIWLDADIIFLNNHWIDQTSALLDKFNVVQPYKKVIRLPPNKTNLTTNENEIKNGNNEGQFAWSWCFKELSGAAGKFEPGFCWAAKKSIFEKLGFYDKMIFGSGDSIMIRAFLNPDAFKDALGPAKFVSKDMLSDIANWQTKISKKVNNQTTYCDGTILHLFHGHNRNRFYTLRLKLLSLSNFDPNTDLIKNEQGCWEWNNIAKNMNILGRVYFKLRNEDTKVHKQAIVSAFWIPSKIWNLKKTIFRKR